MSAPRVGPSGGRQLACVEACPLRCGCYIGKYDADDGWSTFRMRRCCRHWYVPRTFLTAPCSCVFWADGVHDRCPEHAFVSPVLAVPGVQ